MKKIDATKDSVFKAFMEDEKTRDYKAKLIHYITGIKEEELKNAEYVSRELYLEKKNDKTFKSDIIVTFENGIINIEMYRNYKKTNAIKSFKYINKLALEMMKKGVDYNENEIIIQINLNDYPIYTRDRLLYEFGVYEKDLHILHPMNLKIYEIDLDYLRKKSYNEYNELEKWLLLFIEEDITKLKRVKKDMSEENAKAYYEAMKTINRISKEEDVLGLYDPKEEEEWLQALEIKFAKQDVKKETAKKMLELNLDIATIKEVTGLKEEEIMNLK